MLTPTDLVGMKGEFIEDGYGDSLLFRADDGRMFDIHIHDCDLCGTILEVEEVKRVAT